MTTATRTAHYATIAPGEDFNNAAQQAQSLAADGCPAFVAYWKRRSTNTYNLRLAIHIDGFTTYADVGLLHLPQARFEPVHVFPAPAGSPFEDLHGVLAVAADTLPGIITPKGCRVLPLETLQRVFSDALGTAVRHALAGDDD